MTTSGERLVVLSGLSGVSALTHFAAIPLTGGVGASHPASLGAYVVMQRTTMHIAPLASSPIATSRSALPALKRATTPRDKKRAYVFSTNDRCEVFTSPDRVFVTAKPQTVVVSRPPTSVTINAIK